MKIVVSGKGGSGKTTISGTLSRIVGRSGMEVLAIDADTNPNLALTLGFGGDAFDRMVPLPHGLMQRKEVEGRTLLTLARPVDDVTTEFACEGPDNVHLLMVGEVHGAGKG
ncbi:MAG: AAA family ATPase [Actinomycetota bacterium]